MVAKKNKAPPQPAVLHLQNTAEREDQGNSNQPAEDIGNTTPQNEQKNLERIREANGTKL